MGKLFLCREWRVVVYFIWYGGFVFFYFYILISLIYENIMKIERLVIIRMYGYLRILI